MIGPFEEQQRPPTRFFVLRCSSGLPFATTMSGDQSPKGSAMLRAFGFMQAATEAASSAVRGNGVAPPAPGVGGSGGHGGELGSTPSSAA